MVRVHKLSLDYDRRSGGYVNVRNKRAHVIIGENRLFHLPNEEDMPHVGMTEHMSGELMLS